MSTGGLTESEWAKIARRAKELQGKKNTAAQLNSSGSNGQNSEDSEGSQTEPDPTPETDPDNSATEPQSDDAQFAPHATTHNSVFDAQNFDIKPEDYKNLFQRFGITAEEFQELIRFKANHEKRARWWVFMIGVFLMPVTLPGALMGYVRGYNRFMSDKKLLPDFYPMRPIVRVAMIIGAIISWGFLLVFAFGVFVVGIAGGAERFIFLYFVINLLLSLLVYAVFRRWRGGVNDAALESYKFGSARFALKDELFTLKNKKGYYIGNGHLFDDFGHLLTVAGTRGGKGTNIIIPNLLGAGDVNTSWVVIDPKGENAAITARYQREKGQNVIILNPWGLLSEHVGESQSYNPLNMIDTDSINFVDDVQIIAEMIVPVDNQASDPFWSDCARSVVVGLLLYILTEKPKEEQTLGTLWELARLAGDEWDELIQEMGSSMHRTHKKLLRGAANEILKLSAASEETFGGIMASVLQATDFLKSPAMQSGLASGFDPAALADGKTTVYVIIPADKLKTHYRYLRLIVTSLMRAVIRKPNKRVTFLLDEFAALGYISEIEVALSTYAGYNVTVWPILQTLVQLEHLYNKNWQTFISNCTVRQFFSINDMFSANYISEAIGRTSHVITKGTWLGVQSAQSTERLLITPDELRRESGKMIFMFIADLPPTYVTKKPYYQEPDLVSKADPNPYI